MYQNLLKQIGLSEIESKIYLATVELGQSLPKHLAEKANVKRPTLYQTLPQLFAKGLISETMHGKRRYLVAEDPQNFIENKKTALGQIEQAIPQLRLMMATASSKPKIIFYEGVEGMKKVLLDNLNVKMPILEYIGLKKMRPEMVKYFSFYYIAERVRRRIPIKIIIAGSQTYGPINLTATTETTDAFREAKVIENKNFLIPLDIYIYGDNVSFLIYRIDSEPMGIIIRSKEIATSMRSIFDFIWGVL